MSLRSEEKNQYYHYDPGETGYLIEYCSKKTGSLLYNISMGLYLCFVGPITLVRPTANSMDLFKGVSYVNQSC